VGDIVRVVRGGRFIGWYVRYKDKDGRRKQRASHQPTKELARRFLLEIEARVARGSVGIPEPPPPSPTVAELVARFLAEYSRPRIKDLARYRLSGRVALQRALPLLGSLHADAVLPAQIEKLRLTLSRRHAAATVRVTLGFLSTAFSWAVGQGLLAANPVRGVERPAVESSLDFLTRDEVQALLAAAKQRAGTQGLAARELYACVHVAVHTGLRKGELLGLRLRDVDLASRRLTVARSFSRAPKSGRLRHLRLPAACIPVLTAWLAECPRTPEGVLFPALQYGRRPVAGAEHHTLGLAALLTAAGCRRLAHPWHTLRHTFASHFVMAGGNILTLQRILGHSDLRMTLQYAHLAPDFLGEEMDRVSFQTE